MIIVPPSGQPPPQLNPAELRDAIEFAMQMNDRPGLIRQVVQQFVDTSQNILKQESCSIHNGEKHDLTVISEDVTDEDGFSAILTLCRGIQHVDECDRLRAQFVLLHIPSNAGDQANPNPDQYRPSDNIYRRGQRPFTSRCAQQLIAGSMQLHPDNAEHAELTQAINQLDRAAADFIKEPKRLLRITPRELERVVAATYSAHGFDVRLSGGPRDHGIDVIATTYVPVTLPRKFSQFLQVGIQVKRYKKTNKISENVIRDFYGSLLGENLDRGILVTTSSLTAAAQSYLQARRTVQDRITVVAGDEVLELLISYCKQRDVPFWK